MKKTIWLTLLLLSFTATAFAGITGSAHDFSSATMSGEICVLCHTPHGADTTVDNAPLWNHQMTTTVAFIPYDNTSATQDSVPGQPNGASKLCLSCHDNTVAIDAFGGSSGTPADLIATYDRGGTRPLGYANLGTDLSDDHPIGIVYDTTLAIVDGGLYDPETTNPPSFPGKTIKDAMLFNSKVECSSCHDVHNSFGNPSLLIVNNASSALCLTCHDK